ncbi:hypothetical protein [Sphingobacterium sp.]|uniref:hypothetical protein n=1 Tax=Sphingobacterium sp. TaxID=341027 RepID=UPI0031D5D3C1
MIRLKKSNAKSPSVNNDKIAQGVARLILGVQRRWATWMNSQAGKCPPKLRGLILIMLLLLMAAIGATLIMGGFNSTRKVIATASIQVPAVTTEQGNLPDLSEVNASFDRVKKARLYLDSLVQSPSGKQRFDSLNKARPGLNDSIRTAEMLLKQLKQKYGN